MNQQQSVALTFILCLIIFCPNCSAEEGLQLLKPELSIDKETLKPLPLKPATVSVTPVKKESTTMPFQTLRNDAESLVKPISTEKKKELPKETLPIPSTPGTISYQPKLEINKEKWEETRSQVEKAEQQMDEFVGAGLVPVPSKQEAVGTEEIGQDTEETKRLKERIIQEERKRFDEEKGRIEDELQRLRDKARDTKQEKPDVVQDVPEVDGIKPNVEEMSEERKGTEEEKGTVTTGQGTRTAGFVGGTKNILKGLKLPGFKKKVVPAEKKT
ncbi:hypothetical protein HY793_04190 [Candidatus Desantisbacteria bacterium]|nr:hypothetical protein [Candidatus Desantisbacteria bacterium]